MLWLAHTQPQSFGEALTLSSNNPFISLQQALQQCLGTNYCEAGGWLAHEWNLPEILTLSMRYHLDEHYQETGWEVVALVGFAVKMAGQLREGSSQLPPKMWE